MAFDINKGNYGGGIFKDDVTTGIDEKGNRYIYNKSSNQMLHYGRHDNAAGGRAWSLLQDDVKNGRINLFDEGSRYNPNSNSKQNKGGGNPESPTSTGNNYTGGSSYNAAAAEEARQKAFYQALLDSLPGKKEIDRGMIDRKYNDSFSSLTSQRDNAFSNLDSEQRKLDKQRARAYGQIQNDSQNLLQGLNTQLGMYGAGNSSATQMGAIAAADVANKQSAEITDDYNDQLSNISSSRANIKK